MKTRNEIEERLNKIQEMREQINHMEYQASQDILDYLNEHLEDGEEVIFDDDRDSAVDDDEWYMDSISKENGTIFYYRNDHKEKYVLKYQSFDTIADVYYVYLDLK